MTFPLEQLPPEIIPYVFEHLDCKSHAALRVASKKFFELSELNQDFPDIDLTKTLFKLLRRVNDFININKGNPQLLSPGLRLYLFGCVNGSTLVLGPNIAELPKTSSFAFQIFYKKLHWWNAAKFWCEDDIKIKEMNIFYMSSKMSKSQKKAIHLARDHAFHNIMKNSNKKCVEIWEKYYE